jgi:hypothetical protein
MLMLRINWNYQKGEGKVTVTPDFREASWVTKADLLQDAIYELEEMYNQTLKNYGRKDDERKE